MKHYPNVLNPVFLRPFPASLLGYAWVFLLPGKGLRASALEITYVFFALIIRTGLRFSGPGAGSTGAAFIVGCIVGLPDKIKDIQ